MKTITLQEFVDSLTSEQFIRLLDIADPNPMTDEERAYFNSLSVEELAAELEA